MYDILDQLKAWYDTGESFAVATVVHTFASAPRQAGASMAVSLTGEVVGSVSGGCVESAVYELALEVIQTGIPINQRYGFSDEDAFAVGLTCGGIIDVYIEQVSRQNYPDFDNLYASTAQRQPVCTATIVGGPRMGSRLILWPEHTRGSLGRDRLDLSVTKRARGMLDQGKTGIIRSGVDGEVTQDDVTIFVQAYAPPPRMIVFGAIDFAGAVVRMGKFLGYHVTLCDARHVFATKARFPEADDIVVRWPHEYLQETTVDHRTVLCVLTHDPKFDVPLLEIALRSPAVYIGAMGSRHTTQVRHDSLIERGLTDSELLRLRAPIGLDIGGRTPEESAVSIAAEIISLREAGTNSPLSSLTGPIHNHATR
jgi:xanthine dehydrogenase accessory factor